MSDKKQKGFTIIEVVLVLAIAGLIFLMVFIALPALQAGQRDTSRKNDVGIVTAAITTYTSNNRGSLPGTANLVTAVGNLSSYSTVTIDGKEVANVEVKTSAEAGDAAIVPEDSKIIVVTGKVCGAAGSMNTLTSTGATSRSFAVVTKLEAGGGKTYYCQNN